MQTILVDSSVFIAVFIDTDPHHIKSLEFFAFLDRDEKTPISLVLPALVLLEVANVLLRKGVIHDPAEVLKLFPGHQRIPIDDTFIEQALPLFAKINLKSSDAIIACTATLHGAVLVSWDNRLLKEAQKLVPAFTPDEYLKIESL